MYDNVRREDPEVAEAISNEIRRQHDKIELIASESFASERVLEMTGLPLTNQVCGEWRHCR